MMLNAVYCFVAVTICAMCFIMGISLEHEKAFNYKNHEMLTHRCVTLDAKTGNMFFRDDAPVSMP